MECVSPRYALFLAISHRIGSFHDAATELNLILVKANLNHPPYEVTLFSSHKLSSR